MKYLKYITPFFLLAVFFIGITAWQMMTEWLPGEAGALLSVIAVLVVLVLVTLDMCLRSLLKLPVHILWLVEAVLLTGFIIAELKF